jgi:hypothetical protein
MNEERRARARVIGELLEDFVAKRIRFLIDEEEAALYGMAEGPKQGAQGERVLRRQSMFSRLSRTISLAPPLRCRISKNVPGRVLISQAMSPRGCTAKAICQKRVSLCVGRSHLVPQFDIHDCRARLDGSLTRDND